MSPASNGGRFYQVHGSGAIAEALREIHDRALHEGRGPEVAEALHILRHRLQRNPSRLGEPLYRLTALQMEIRMVAIGPLVVSFGVCEDRPLVFIKAVSLLS
jgi:hypothetical protein